MATNDVPGAKAHNRDNLHTGCWAESENSDGSYIFVEGVENGIVVYEIFDTSKTPVMSFRDAMPENQFKKRFTWDATDPASIKWKWHDKQDFPWNIVITKGLQSGTRYAFGGDLVNAAANVADMQDRLNAGTDDDDTGAGAAARRVARDLGLRGRALQEGETGRVRRALSRLRDGIQGAIDELGA